MKTYFVRFAFSCDDVPYRRHMVTSVQAESLLEASFKAQRLVDNSDSNRELISVYETSEIEHVISKPKFGGYKTTILRTAE